MEKIEREGGRKKEEERKHLTTSGKYLLRDIRGGGRRGVIK